MAVKLQQNIEQLLSQHGKHPEEAVAQVFDSCDPRMFFEIMKFGSDVDQRQERFDHLPRAYDVDFRRNVSGVREPRRVFSCFKPPPALPHTYACGNCGYRDYVHADGFVDERATSGDVVCPRCGTCCEDRVVDEAGMNWGKYTFDDFVGIDSFEKCQEKRIRYSQDSYFFEHLQKVLGNEFFSPSLVRDPRFHQLLRDDVALRAVREGGPVALKEYMRKLRLGRLFYQHTHSICAKLQGRSTGLQKLTVSELDELQRMFKKTNGALAKVKGPRKNGLNYGFVMRKLTAMIGRKDLTNIIPKLKTRSRLSQHQQLWSKVCQENMWYPHPEI